MTENKSKRKIIHKPGSDDALKVLCYMSEHMYQVPDDSSTYFLKHMLVDPSFDVTISFDSDPTLVEDKELIFTRFEIPIKDDFLTALSAYDDGSRVFVNAPEAKKKYWTKDYMELFLDSDILPPTWVSSDPAILANAAKDYQERLIIKPLDLNGGKGIVDLYPSQFSNDQLLEHFSHHTHQGNNKIILQSFIDGVEKLGDKRVNVVFYEPSSAFLRLPAEGSYICNISAGGRSVDTKITDRDCEIASKLEPFFRANNITWAGIDIIGPYLSELNVSSPGGLYEADHYNGNTKGLDHLISKVKTIRKEGTAHLYNTLTKGTYPFN